MNTTTFDGFDLYESLESSVRVYCRKFPKNFIKAKNHLIWDSDGRTYIDFMSGSGALNYGHNHPNINSALIEYLQSNGLIHSLDLHTPAKAGFLKAFNEVILQPRNMNYRIQFTGPTGSNAVEAALKISRRETGRIAMICFTDGFHGMSLGALSLTGNGMKRSSAGVPLNHAIRMPFCGYLGKDVDTIAYIEKVLEDTSSGIDKPAAIVAETVQGEGGVNVASFDWLKKLSELTTRYELLLIIDDIQAGCGRTGKFFSFEEAGIYPDIVCLSKSIAGGHPMSIVLIKQHLDNQSPGEHTGTFRGNNLAFVAAQQAVQFWNDPQFIQEVGGKCLILQKRLIQLGQKYINHGVLVRGRGMFHGVEFPSTELAVSVQQHSFRNGLIVETCGASGRVIKILPPLTIETSALVEGLNIIESAIDEML